MKPRIFVGSSVEHLDVAYAAQEGLDRDAEVTVWSQGVFALSRTSMLSLIEILDDMDFGLFVLSPDDITKIRDEDRNTVRDNVIFELGLFIGRLGVDRCFMLVPRGAEDLHLPSDLTGIVTGTYEPNRQDGNLVAALGPSCNRVRKSIAKLGRHDQATSAPLAEDATLTVAQDLCDDENDCISLIQAWMGKRASVDNQGATRFDHVDRTLRLKPGSARQHIERAAQYWGYRVARKGKDTIMFEHAPGNNAWMA